MTEKEVIPEAVDFMEQVVKNAGWSPVYRRQLEELFKNIAFRSALKDIILASDEQLKNIGMTDFTDPIAIQNALRAQGTAAGLVQAVELICGLASTPENPPAEENNNA